MINRRTLLQSSAVIAALSSAAPLAAQSADSIRVVATFSILGDMVKRIGGKQVSVTTLVGPGGDTHVYQPTPADARALSEAELLVVNGLDFEGWLDRLVDASDFNGMRVTAADGIDTIGFEDMQDDHDGEHNSEHGDDHHDDHGDEHHGTHDHDHDKDDHGEHDDAHAGHLHGAFDPHGWQSLRNALIYVDNITAALAQTEPAHAAEFYGNRAGYIAEIKALDAEITEIVAGLPDDRRTVVTSHDAFQYFGRDYGLIFLAPQGISTDSEASAQQVAGIIQQMRAEGISAVFIENITDSRLLEQIANETGARIGGTLYNGALSGANGPASTYLDMMRHNARTLAGALGS